MSVTEAMREAYDVLPPISNFVYSRQGVTTTEVLLLPWNDTTGPASNDSHYWSVVAYAQPVWVMFGTSNSLTVTVASANTLTTNTLTPSTSIGLCIPANSSKDFRVPRNMLYFAHNALVTTGRIYLYQSGGPGRM